MFNAASLIEKPTKTIINSKQYSLNKSNTKFVNIGLLVEKNFEPCIEFSGQKQQSVVMSEEDWKILLQYQGVIANYLCSSATYREPIIDLQNITIHFEVINQTPIMKIKKNESYVYMGNETACNLWHQIPLIEYRLNILYKQKFELYFNIFKCSLLEEKNCLQKVYDTLSPEENQNSENVCTMLEFLLINPELMEEKLKPKKFYEENEGRNQFNTIAV